jgi:hypothetical protein
MLLAILMFPIDFSALREVRELCCFPQLLFSTRSHPLPLFIALVRV